MEALCTDLCTDLELGRVVLLDLDRLLVDLALRLHPDLPEADLVDYSHMTSEKITYFWTPYP